MDYINQYPAVHSKRALIIGNNNYSRSENRLHHCTDSADDLTILLSEMDFNVKTHHNLDHRELLNAVTEFSETIADGDVALFYFAGHTYAIEDEKYFIPVDDGRIETNRDVEDCALKATNVVKRLVGRNEANMTILVLDCCRRYRLPKTPRKSKNELKNTV